jgi:hypothetical protein
VRRHAQLVVPAASVIDVIRKHGRSLGIPSMGREKSKGLYEDMLTSIEVCTRADVRSGLGSGHVFHKLRGSQLALRAE